MIFGFDSSRQELVYPHPMTGAESRIHVNVLARYWEPSNPDKLSRDLTLALPRVGQPPLIQTAPAGALPRMPRR